MSEPVKIVVLDGYAAMQSDLSFAALERYGQLEVWERCESRAEVLERATGARIVLTNKTVLDRSLLTALPELRFVSVLATGYNVIDIAAARELGIQVSNTPGYSTLSVAQHTLALLLALTNQTGDYAGAVAAGEWCRSRDFTLSRGSICELDGLTLGIIGGGQIGQAVARIAVTFGLRVLIHTRTPRPGLPGTCVDLPTLLRESDVVSLHCPLTAENKGMINAAAVVQMKRGALLLNTARGGLLDEAAVAAALNAGHLGGAALDVLSDEPPAPGNPLLAARHCLITPHVAWASRAARQRLLDINAANVAAFLAGSAQNLVS